MWRLVAVWLAVAAAAHDDSYVGCKSAPKEATCQVVDKDKLRTEFYQKLASTAYPSAIEVPGCDYLLTPNGISDLVEHRYASGRWEYKMRLAMVASDCARSSTVQGAQCGVKDESVIQYCYADFTASANETHAAELVQKSCGPALPQSSCIDPQGHRDEAPKALENQTDKERAEDEAKDQEGKEKQLMPRREEFHGKGSFAGKRKARRPGYDQDPDYLKENGANDQDYSGSKPHGHDYGDYLDEYRGTDSGDDPDDVSYPADSADSGDTDTDKPPDHDDDYADDSRNGADSHPDNAVDGDVDYSDAPVDGDDDYREDIPANDDYSDKSEKPKVQYMPKSERLKSE